MIDVLIGTHLSTRSFSSLDLFGDIHKRPTLQDLPKSGAPAAIEINLNETKRIIHVGGNYSQCNHQVDPSFAAAIDSARELSGHIHWQKSCLSSIVADLGPTMESIDNLQHLFANEDMMPNTLWGVNTSFFNALNFSNGSMTWDKMSTPTSLYKWSFQSQRFSRSSSSSNGFLENEGDLDCCQSACHREQFSLCGCFHCFRRCCGGIVLRRGRGGEFRIWSSQAYIVAISASSWIFREGGWIDGITQSFSNA